MGEVDGRVVLDGGAARARGTMMERVGCLAGRAAREGLATRERRRSKCFMLERERGRENALLRDLVAAGSAGGAVW
jgi:hypothetical protein